MKKAFVVLGLAALLVGCDEKNDRAVTSLCGEWEFVKDPAAKLAVADAAFKYAKWEKVEVPHDWAIVGPFDPSAGGGTGKLPWRGVGWYRRTFTLADAEFARVKAGGALWLEFDGVMASPRVYVNGQLAGGWDYGYMSFRVDAAPFVKAGENTLAVRADTRSHNSRWYPGAGIYRAVRLVSAPAVHVLPATEFVTTPKVGGNRATVHVAFTVTNQLGVAASAEAGVRVCDAAGRAVGKARLGAYKLRAGGSLDFALDVEVKDPKLWDVESPNLYTAEIGVRSGEEVDAKTVRFGIRTFEFTADDGFHLNGRRVQLNGVDLHSDMGPLGMAFNRSVMQRQLAIMKDMGANALRTSHNACDPQVLDLCDEMGFFVWNECFDKWDGTSGRRNDQNLEEYVSLNLREFAKRDRNHPSVFVWSIGNEIAPNGYDWGGKNPASTNGMSAARFREFRNAIREFDTTRPVGIGCCHGNAVEMSMFEELDITGWNYNRQYANMKSQYPDKPVLYSESASALSSYGFFSAPPSPHKTAYNVAEREVDGYDHNAAVWSDIPDAEFWRMETDRYCGGEFVWTGIDYLGEPTPYIRDKQFKMMDVVPKEELARSSYFGIVDLMGIPKDRFWLYRSHWNKKDETIHILPHWNWEGRAKNVPVYVYTSGDSAELFLNGKSLGRQFKDMTSEYPLNGTRTLGLQACGDCRTNSYYDVCARYRLRWFDVPYEPGELRAVAYRAGKKIGEQTMKTAGKPVAVSLTPESNELPADGETCVFVQVDLVDANGVRDPWANNRVSFKLDGPGKILAVGNGNPRGHDSFKDVASHPLYFGKAVAVVRREKGVAGPITLTASAEGVKSAVATFP
jgi:beta-galactosidase